MKEKKESDLRLFLYSGNCDDIFSFSKNVKKKRDEISELSYSINRIPGQFWIEWEQLWKVEKSFINLTKALETEVE